MLKDLNGYFNRLEKSGKHMLEQCWMMDWIDFEDRRLNLNDVDEESIQNLSYYIQLYNKLDKDVPVSERKEIKLLINSNGGLLIDAMYLVSIIKQSKTPVVGIIEARAYSAGGLILVACHKKYCYPNSTFLLHCGSNGFIGDTAKMIDTVEFDKRYETKVREHYLESTNISDELYNEKYRHEWYLDAEEMLEHGVVDGILGEHLF